MTREQFNATPPSQLTVEQILEAVKMDGNVTSNGVNCGSSVYLKTAPNSNGIIRTFKITSHPFGDKRMTVVFGKINPDEFCPMRNDRWFFYSDEVKWVESIKRILKKDIACAYLT